VIESAEAVLTKSLLLDSNALIGYASQSKAVGKKTIRLLDSSDLYFSPLSLAELKIKELRVPGFRSNLDQETLLEIGFKELPYDSLASGFIGSIETRDPFDLMLVSQAASRSMTFITTDLSILRSGLSFVWDLTD